VDNTEPTTTLHVRMESAIDELWETLMQTCPILMKEWLTCFYDDHDEARSDITSTLSNNDAWKNPRGNFLLRLVSDDKTGYRSSSSGKYKPRVQLALAFVHHMSKNSRFADFIGTTLSVRARQEESSCSRVSDEPEQNDSSNSPVKNQQSDVLGIRLVNLSGNDDRRGRPMLHTVPS